MLKETEFFEYSPNGSRGKSNQSYNLAYGEKLLRLLLLLKLLLLLLPLLLCQDNKSTSHQQTHIIVFVCVCVRVFGSV